MNDTNVWQSIETAPRDGTVILSDAGLVCFLTKASSASSISRVTGWRGIGWYMCHMNGVIIDDSDYGIYKEDPFWWMPIPPIPVYKV